MSDDEAIREYTRLRTVACQTVLEVVVISWPEPHTPAAEWVEYARWPAAPTRDELKAAQTNALADERYFRRCRRCGEISALGHMHNRTTCQGCAEKHLGVVH